MAKLYRECEQCDGGGAYLNAAIPPEPMYKDCPNCDCGLIEIKPAKDVEALARECYIMAISLKTEHDIAIKITAFCEKREAGKLKLRDDLLLEQTGEQAVLRADNERLREEVAKWKRIRTPTHGRCCTCQSCGEYYDDCRCELNSVTDDLSQCQIANRRLREELGRAEGRLRVISQVRRLTELERQVKEIIDKALQVKP